MLVYLKHILKKKINVKLEIKEIKADGSFCAHKPSPFPMGVVISQNELSVISYSMQK